MPSAPRRLPCGPSRNLREAKFTGFAISSSLAPKRRPTPWLDCAARGNARPGEEAAPQLGKVTSGVLLRSGRLERRVRAGSPRESSYATRSLHYGASRDGKCLRSRRSYSDAAAFGTERASPDPFGLPTGALGLELSTSEPMLSGRRTQSQEPVRSVTPMSVPRAQTPAPYHQTHASPASRAGIQEFMPR